MKPSLIAELYRQVEAAHDIKLKNVIIKAACNSKYKHCGWVFPGKFIIKDKAIAYELANILDKWCNCE